MDRFDWRFSHFVSLSPGPSVTSSWRLLRHQSFPRNIPSAPASARIAKAVNEQKALSPTCSSPALNLAEASTYSRKSCAFQGAVTRMDEPLPTREWATRAPTTGNPQPDFGPEAYGHSTRFSSVSDAWNVVPSSAHTPENSPRPQRTSASAQSLADIPSSVEGWTLPRALQNAAVDADTSIPSSSWALRTASLHGALRPSACPSIRPIVVRSSKARTRPPPRAETPGKTWRNDSAASRADGLAKPRERRSAVSSI